MRIWCWQTSGPENVETSDNTMETVNPEASRLLLTQLSDLVDENESLREACAALTADLALARVQCDRLRDALATAGVQLTPHTN